MISFKSMIRKLGPALKAAQAKKAAETKQSSATPPQQKAEAPKPRRGGPFGKSIVGAIRKAKEAKTQGTGSAAKPAITNAAAGAIGGGMLTGKLKGKRGLGGFIGKAMGAAARRAKMKGEGEEDKPQAFKKGGSAKKKTSSKGRGMGAATKGGGACAPCKMMGGGYAKKMNKGGMC